MRTRTRPRTVTTSAIPQDGRTAPNRIDFDKAAADAVQFIPSPSDLDFTVQDSIIDEVTPNYRERVAAGEILATNRLTVTKVPDPSIAWFYTASVQQVGPNSFSGGFYSGQLALHSILNHKRLISDSEKNSTRVEAIAKLRSQGWDYLTSSAEAGQLIKMLVGLKKSLTAAIVGCARETARLNRKSSLRKDMVHMYKSFQSVWLEGRFGWRILYYDIMAIHDFINNMDNEKKLIVGRGAIKQTSNETVKYNMGPYGYQCLTAEFTREHQYKVGYPGLVDFSVVGNPSMVNTIWEVIPFSLVVDWFFDVQSLVQAFSGKPKNVAEQSHANYEVDVLRTTVACRVSVPVFSSRIPVKEDKSDLVVLSGSVITRNRPGPIKLGLTFKPSVSGLVWIDLAMLLEPMYKAFRR